MCKKIVLVMSLVLALSLGASGAWGELINCPDLTLIQTESGAGPLSLGGWQDVVGPTTPFQTFNATFDTSSHVLTMFTNWGPGDKSFGSVISFLTADLFLNYNPNTNTADAAVRLRGGLGTTLQTVFYNPTIQTSEDLLVPSGVLAFGGRYTTNIAPAIGPPSFEVPVQASAGTSTGTASVTWTAFGAEPLFSFAVDLDQITGLDFKDFSFLWGTATCGNDVITCTPIPLPPSLLLLGSGLLGLGGWRRFRKS